MVSRARQLKVFADIKLLSDLLCESHSAKRRDEIVARMLPLLLQITPKGKKADRQKALAQVLKRCAYAGDEATVIIDDAGLLFVNGNFDVDDLANRMVWGGLVDDANMQTVGG